MFDVTRGQATLPLPSRNPGPQPSAFLVGWVLSEVVAVPHQMPKAEPIHQDSVNPDSPASHTAPEPGVSCMTATGCVGARW